MEPNRPETGYGYIEEGLPLEASPARQVSHFHEKPDARRAEAYLAAGNYLWYPSLFLFRAGFYLDELERCTPGIVVAVRRAVE